MNHSNLCIERNRKIIERKSVPTNRLISSHGIKKAVFQIKTMIKNRQYFVQCLRISIKGINFSF